MIFESLGLIGIKIFFALSGWAFFVRVITLQSRSEALANLKYVLLHSYTPEVKLVAKKPAKKDDKKAAKKK
jgi:hypothetical protein